jgi:hypothetical protein
MQYLWNDKANELREVVIRAHKACMRAAEESNAIMQDVPSGLPHPDGVQRLANAAKVERHALDENLKAMREFKDYINGSR